MESGHEARILLIDFSAAFDRIIHLGILYKLCSVGIGDSVLPIQYWHNFYQIDHIMHVYDGRWSE